jgi:hypothetical protein
MPDVISPVTVDEIADLWVDAKCPEQPLWLFRVVSWMVSAPPQPRAVKFQTKRQRQRLRNACGLICRTAGSALENGAGDREMRMYRQILIAIPDFEARECRNEGPLPFVALLIADQSRKAIATEGGRAKKTTPRLAPAAVFVASVMNRAGYPAVTPAMVENHYGRKRSRLRPEPRWPEPKILRSGTKSE